MSKPKPYYPHPDGDYYHGTVGYETNWIGNVTPKYIPPKVLSCNTGSEWKSNLYSDPNIYYIQDQYLNKPDIANKTQKHETDNYFVYKLNHEYSSLFANRSKYF